MNRKKKFFVGTVIILCIIIINGFTYIPHKIINIASDKVSSIQIFNGTNGQQITLTNENDIEHVINNLSSITFYKDNLSLFSLGYVYKVTIFNQSGNTYKKLIIQSSDTIRYKGFFYRDKTRSIDNGYISKLFD